MGEQGPARAASRFGSRGGNRAVMRRGTFANIRLRNEMAPGTEGGVTRHQPSGEQMSIYDAAMKYARDGVPLVVVGGKEYGTGSSRVWAAKGTCLLGVRAGIGSSSRVVDAGTVGVLVVANGGEPRRLSVNGIPVGRWLAGLTPLPGTRRRAFAAVIVTDAPLLPGQLDHLAQRSFFGLVRVGLVDEVTTSGTIIAVSTTGLDDSMEGLAPGTVTARRTPDVSLPALFGAGADACEEAVLNALVVAHTQRSTDGVPGLPVDAFRDTAAR